jgi:hypothetical protein
MAYAYKYLYILIIFTIIGVPEWANAAIVYFTNLETHSYVANGSDYSYAEGNCRRDGTRAICNGPGKIHYRFDLDEAGWNPDCALNGSNITRYGIAVFGKNDSFWGSGADIKIAYLPYANSPSNCSTDWRTTDTNPYILGNFGNSLQNYGAEWTVVDNVCSGLHAPKLPISHGSVSNPYYVLREGGSRTCHSNGRRTIIIESGTNDNTIVESAYMYVYANVQLYNLTVNSGGTANVSISGSSSMYRGETSYTRAIPSGSSFSLNAPPSAGGKIFSNWSNCTSSSGTTCAVTMTSNKTVTANYSSVPTCSYDILPQNKTFSSAADSVIVNVDANSSSCGWSVSENLTWVTPSKLNGTGSGSVTLNVTANSSLSSRTGIVTIAGKSFTITQEGMGCSYTISPQNKTFSSAADSVIVNVDANSSSCGWSVSENLTWVTPSKLNGTGSGSVALNVTANSSLSSRTGIVTIAGKSFTITQEGMGCSYTISPQNKTFSSAADSVIVNVDANSSSCGWSVSENLTWVTPSKLNGTGSGSVALNVTANSSLSSRTGIVTIAGKSFTITQEGMGCSYTISPQNKTFSSAADSVIVNVDANSSSCGWSVSENLTWVTPSKLNGTGSGSVALNVTANSSLSSRTGIVTIAGKSFTITQEGMGCSYTISPERKDFTSGFGVVDVSVDASSALCSWTVSENLTWVTPLKLNGTGSGSVTLNVTENSSLSSRTGIVTIAGKSFTITQNGGYGVCTYNLIPTSIHADHNGRCTNCVDNPWNGNAVNVNTTGFPCYWTPYQDASWINVQPSYTQIGDLLVYVNIQPNWETTPRSGTVTLGGVSLPVNQDGMYCTLRSISPTNNSFDSNSHSFGVAIDTNGCDWRASIEDQIPWVVLSKTIGTGDESIIVSIYANDSTLTRSATIDFAAGNIHKYLTINQSGTNCSYDISPQNKTFSSAADSVIVNVDANSSSCGWSVSENLTWVTPSKLNGTGSGSVALNVTANSSLSSRTGIVTIAGKSFTITQEGMGCSYTISPQNKTFSSAADSVIVNVDANSSSCGWSVSENLTWVTPSKLNGTGSGSVALNVTANSSLSSRTGIVTIAGKSFTITQEGISLDPQGKSITPQLLLLLGD